MKSSELTLLPNLMLISTGGPVPSVRQFVSALWVVTMLWEWLMLAPVASQTLLVWSFTLLVPQAPRPFLCWVSRFQLQVKVASPLSMDEPWAFCIPSIQCPWGYSHFHGLHSLGLFYPRLCLKSPFRTPVSSAHLLNLGTDSGSPLFLGIEKLWASL